MENENIIEHTYADEVSPLTLAFVGDGVYDLLVRAYLVRQSNRPVGELNKIKVGFVNCKSQAEYAKVANSSGYFIGHSACGRGCRQIAV